MNETLYTKYCKNCRHLALETATSYRQLFFYACHQTQGRHDIAVYNDGKYNAALNQATSVEPKEMKFAKGFVVPEKCPYYLEFMLEHQ